MNARDLENAVPKLARNEMFYFVARLCMMVSLPLGGFIGARVLYQNDAMALAVAEQNVSLKVLSVSVKDRLDANVAQLTDHELRLRALERPRPN